jgi:putative PIN family toxin of toxin-antitoxin system
MEKVIKKTFKDADIYVSPLLLKEYRDTPLKLAKQGKINHQQLKVLIAGIAAFVANAKIVCPTEKVSVCRDPNDDMLLECCLTAKARVLITSNKDLLETKNLPFDRKIVTPRKFIEKF